MRYGVAVAAVLIAFIIRYSIYGDLQNRLVFTFFVPAAVIAVWYGGMGPGIVATVLGFICGDYFFSVSSGTLFRLGNRESLALGAYAVTTLLCVLLCERLHRHIRVFERALENERHHVRTPLCPEVQEFADFLTQYYGASQRNDYAYPSWPYRRALVARVGVALAIVAVAFFARYSLFGDVNRFAFLFFVPAALIAVWYGGIVPGLLAAALGLMLGDYFFLSGHEALGELRDAERMQIGIYAVTTTLCVMLFENLHERIRRLEHAFDRARFHHQHMHA